VSAVIETISKVDTSVPVFMVIGLESRQNSKFYPRSVSVLLNRSDDLDSNVLIPLLVSGLHNLAECALTEEFGDLVYLLSV
jgi:hypothetical protein